MFALRSPPAALHCLVSALGRRRGISYYGCNYLKVKNAKCLQLYPPHCARAKSCSLVFQPDQCSYFKSLGNLVAGGTSAGLAESDCFISCLGDGWGGFPLSLGFPGCYWGQEMLWGCHQPFWDQDLRKWRISHFGLASSY